jgi:hypothetical protein
VTGMVVGIGFVSSIWLIGLIVEEDPVNRMPFTLSNERNLPEFRSVDDGELAMCHVVPGKGNRAVLRRHIQKHRIFLGFRTRNVGCRRTDPLGGFLTGLRTLC